MTSSKIKLPDVTLICLTNQKFDEHKKAIDKSCQGIDFGAVKLIWDEKCNSIDEWNKKIMNISVKKLSKILRNSNKKYLELRCNHCLSGWMQPTVKLEKD